MNEIRLPISGALRIGRARLMAKDVRTQLVPRHRLQCRKGTITTSERLLDSLLDRLTVLRRNLPGPYPASDFLGVAADLPGKGGLGRECSNGALDIVHAAE